MCKRDTHTRIIEKTYLLETQAEEEHGDAQCAENAGQDSCGDEDVARSGVGGRVVGKQVYLIVMHVNRRILENV